MPVDAAPSEELNQPPGYYDVADLRRAREAGNCFETFICHHLRVLAQQLIPPARPYYWRTRTGQLPAVGDALYSRATRLESKLRRPQEASLSSLPRYTLARLNSR